MYFAENVEEIRVKPIIIVDSLKPGSKSSHRFVAAWKDTLLYLPALNLQVGLRKARNGATDIRSNTALGTITD